MNGRVKCPRCGMEGFLERRGNSPRVVHYKGFINGKRAYEKHSIVFSDSQLIPIEMGINDP